MTKPLTPKRQVGIQSGPKGEQNPVVAEIRLESANLPPLAPGPGDDLVDCDQLVFGAFIERGVNALNIEPIQPLGRCKMRLPKHWEGNGKSSMRWLASGGSPMVFGLCSSGACPGGPFPRGMISHNAIPLVEKCVELGRVVHAIHPDFGGVLTIGRFTSACSPRGFATVSHGGSYDVGYYDVELLPVVRSFVFQVGKRIACAAALKSLASCE